MTRLVVTADAETDTAEILNYLSTEAGPRVAEDFGRRFRIAIERFVRIPGVGAPRPVLGKTTRASIVFPYVLIYDYTEDDDTVTLLRILHGRRNITRGLLRGETEQR